MLGWSDLSFWVAKTISYEFKAYYYLICVEILFVQYEQEDLNQQFFS